LTPSRLARHDFSRLRFDELSLDADAVPLLNGDVAPRRYFERVLLALAARERQRETEDEH
jgi:hypothetical protein